MLEKRKPILKSGTLKITIPTTFIGMFLIGIGFFAGQSYESPPESQIQALQPNQIRTCFTPGGSCESLIVDEIQDAKSSIRLQVYSFTSKPITQSLLEAHKRGVKIEILCDRSQQKEKYSKIHDLESSGIATYIDRVDGLAHNKTIIVDDKTVITGSYNFTYSAQNRNSENLLIIKSDDISKAYLKNWQKRMEGATPIKSTMNNN